MSISSFDNRRSYAGNGSTVAFAFPPPFTADTDLVVQVQAADNSLATKLLGTDYTVAGAGSPSGGTVTMAVAPAAGTTLIIDRDVPITQSVTFQDGGPLPAATLNGALDRAAMWGQRLKEQVDGLDITQIRSLAGQTQTNTDIATTASANAQAANAGAQSAATIASAAGQAVLANGYIAIGQDGDLLIGLVDSKSRQTFASARVKDGAPTDWAKMLILMRLKEDHALGDLQPAPGILFGVTDAAGRRTWIEASDKDGGLTAWSKTLLVSSLSTDYNLPLSTSVPGYLFAVSDSAGRLSDLAVRGSDGQVPDYAIQRWADRIWPLIQDEVAAFTGEATAVFPAPDLRPSVTVTPTAKETYWRSGETLPVYPTITQVTGYGASDTAPAAVMNQMVARLRTTAGGTLTYTQRAWGGRNSTQLAARLNSLPYLFTATAGKLAAGQTVVSGTISNDQPPHFDDGGPSSSANYMPGTLCGVHGYITIDNNASTARFTADAAPSADVTIPPDSPYICDLMLNNRNDVLVIGGGGNDWIVPILQGQPGLSWATTPEKSWEIKRKNHEFLSPLFKRVIYTSEWLHGEANLNNADTTNWCNYIDQKTKEAFGNQFVDLRAIMKDPNLWNNPWLTNSVPPYVPSQAEKDSMAQGRLYVGTQSSPTAYWTSGGLTDVIWTTLGRDGSHPDSRLHAIFQDAVRQRMIDLGWYISA